MKATFYPFLAAVSLLLISYGCKNDPEKEDLWVVSGKLISNTECKMSSTKDSTFLIDSITCAEFSYNAITHTLLLKHINAGFNCAPGDLSISVHISNDTIVIEEFESSNFALCNCLFDLDIEVQGIEAKPYQIKFIEPYCVNQEPLIFGVDFSTQTAGIHCIPRYGYPWSYGN